MDKSLAHIITSLLQVAVDTPFDSDLHRKLIAVIKKVQEAEEECNFDYIKEVYESITNQTFPEQPWNILVGDNSGHDYVIPEAKSDDWYEWCDIPEDDERSWDAPDYAERVEGGFKFKEYTD